MKPLDLDKVCRFVNENIVDFHRARLNSLERLTRSEEHTSELQS